MSTLLDWWTLGHFLCGVVASSTIYPTKPLISLAIANTFHLIGELLEKKYNDKGEIISSFGNNVTDIIAFLLGSILGLYFTKYTIKYPIVRWILLVILILIFIQEAMREIFPDTWFFDSANKPVNW